MKITMPAAARLIGFGYLGEFNGFGYLADFNGFGYRDVFNFGCLDGTTSMILEPRMRSSRYCRRTATIV